MKLAVLNGQPEIFCSFQGEGKNLGKKCVFIRLSGCNLFCHWCDTPNTWNFTGTLFDHKNSDVKFDRKIHQLKVDPMDVAALALKYHVPHYVLTGGEPLLQQKELAETCNTIKKVQADAYFEVETNGTFKSISELNDVVDQYNVSVKLTNSRVPDKLRVKPDVIRFYAQNPKSNFKFVICNESDLDEVNQLVKAFKIEKNNIYLMPEGTNSMQLEKTSSFVESESEKLGYNFTDRLHIRMYGDERGR